MTTRLGKWGDGETPQRGWLCEDVIDLGEERQVCAMCETQEIRYVHRMTHRDGLELDAGCVCAGHMEGDIEGARKREKDARARERWVRSRRWRVGESGKWRRKVGRCRVTLFERRGDWRVRVAKGGEVTWGRRRYPTPEAAARACWGWVIARAKEGAGS